VKREADRFKNIAPFATSDVRLDFDAYGRKALHVVQRSQRPGNLCEGEVEKNLVARDLGNRHFRGAGTEGGGSVHFT
jgi:hypothetical protein